MATESTQEPVKTVTPPSIETKKPKSELTNPESEEKLHQAVDATLRLWQIPSKSTLREETLESQFEERRRAEQKIIDMATTNGISAEEIKAKSFEKRAEQALRAASDAYLQIMRMQINGELALSNPSHSEAIKLRKSLERAIDDAKRLGIPVEEIQKAGTELSRVNFKKKKAEILKEATQAQETYDALMRKYHAVFNIPLEEMPVWRASNKIITTAITRWEFTHDDLRPHLKKSQNKN